MNRSLADVLAPAYSPCAGFSGPCVTMRWAPEAGHIPRGFLGAASDLSRVELVLVNAEPGNPLSDERYPIPSSSNAESAAFEFLRSRKTRFHKNLVLLLDLCFPGTDLKYQYERVWITNAVLCSAVALCGPVPSDCERHCVNQYLAKQLDLLPNACVITLGGKAEKRLNMADVRAVKTVNTFHPAARVSNEIRRDAYERAADIFKKNRKPFCA